MTTKMCDAVGMAHEFLLALKKAGLTDEIVQNIISNKSNALAETMMDTYFFIVGRGMFEIVNDFEFEIPEIEPSKLMRDVVHLLREREDNYHSNLLNVYGQSSPLSGRKRAVIFKNTVLVEEKLVYSFIKNHGLFPGIFGLACAWRQRVYLENKHDFPLKKQVFAFEEKRIASAGKLINLGIIGRNEKPIYSMALEGIKNRNFRVDTHFLMLQDLE